MIRYTGLLAPEEVPTGDRRVFAAGKGTWREHVPVMSRFTSGGHENAVLVGKILKTFPGPGGTWGTIDFFDPAVVPEVTKTVYMLQKKAMGPSVDIDQDFTVEVIAHPKRPDTKAGRFTAYNVVGITLVPMPAFAEVHLSADEESERALLASAGVDLSTVLTYFDINKAAWDAWPLAPREYKYDADDAVKRIAGWAGIGSKTPSLEHYASAFLWRDGNQTGDTMAQDSFRLPLADIIGGQPHLIYHAVYAAAALLSGAHGGLPNIPNGDKEAMKGVINTIYAKMAQTFGDSGMKSPFDPNAPRKPQEAALETADCGCEDQIEESEMMDSAALLASVAPVAPPRAWFDQPKVSGPTPFTITEDGRVFGHVAEWRKCHVGVGNACVIAPKTRTGYKYFRLGPVVCDDGSEIKCGKITFGAGHANDQWGVMPARDHYDNSAWAAAVVNVGEDEFGIWVAGSLTASMEPAKIAELRRSPLSGDWRRVDGNLELIAALAVNSPGFPVVRQQGDGTFSMMGVGMVEFTLSDEVMEGVTDGFTEADKMPDTEFAEKVAAKLEEIDAKEQDRRAANKGKRIEEIDGKQQELAASSESSIIARQMNAKFVPVAE